MGFNSAFIGLMPGEGGQDWPLGPHLLFSGYWGSFRRHKVARECCWSLTLFPVPRLRNS